MTKVVGIEFNDTNKIYYFSVGNFELHKDDKVIVDTERGLQLGFVKIDIFDIDPSKLSFALKDIKAIASSDDYNKFLNNVCSAKKALDDANKFIDELNLNMKILNASFTLDKKQLLFNFLADDRVDFRALAKKLAAIYKTRIELRQIGVRDKAKEVGGIGQCGRCLCCSNFLKDINSVSINMAKNQNLALNPQKINGVCGRLMCCLSYENETYSEEKKKYPKIGDNISVGNDKGKVIDVDIFSGKYKVKLSDDKVIEVGVKQ